MDALHQAWRLNDDLTRFEGTFAAIGLPGFCGRVDFKIGITLYAPYLYFTLTVCDAYTDVIWYEVLDGRWGEVRECLRSRLYRLICCGGDGWPEAFIIDGVMVHVHLLIDGQVVALTSN